MRDPFPFHHLEKSEEENFKIKEKRPVVKIIFIEPDFEQKYTNWRQILVRIRQKMGRHRVSFNRAALISMGEPKTISGNNAVI